MKVLEDHSKLPVEVLSEDRKVIKLNNPEWQETFRITAKWARKKVRTSIQGDIVTRVEKSFQKIYETSTAPNMIITTNQIQVHQTSLKPCHPLE